MKTIEDVKPLHEIEEMPYERARSYLIDVRAKYSTAKLIAHWKETSLPNENIYGSKIYKTLRQYKVPVLTDRTKKAHEVKSAKAAKKESMKIFDKRPKEYKIPFDDYKTIEAVPEQKPSKKASFAISLEGEWDGTQIVERISSIASLLKDNTRYNIKIELQETGD